jgi:hypothetical protein
VSVYLIIINSYNNFDSHKIDSARSLTHSHSLLFKHNLLYLGYIFVVVVVVVQSSNNKRLITGRDREREKEKRKCARTRVLCAFDWTARDCRWSSFIFINLRLPPDSTGLLEGIENFTAMER